MSERCPEGFDIAWAPEWAHAPGCPFYRPELHEPEPELALDWEQAPRFPMLPVDTAAIRNAALEEAAKLADVELFGSKRNLAERETGFRIANAIRALKTPSAAASVVGGGE